MNKVVPITGLIIFLLVVGIWLSKPNPTSVGTVAAQSEESSETSEQEETTEETTNDSEAGEPTEEAATEESQSEPETTEGDEAGETDTDTQETTEESEVATDTQEDAETSEGEESSEAEETTEETVTEMLPIVIPEGFTETPLLSDTQLQVFDGASQVTEEGKDYQVLIQTSKGLIRADLFEDEAPNTVNNFVFLTGNQYYNGIVFHRVLEDFMAQTGDPTGTGRGDAGYKFDDEFAPDLSHDKPGILSMANSGPNTNGSQFFITFAETPWLDGRHSIFGEVIEGDDVLAKLTRIDPSNPNPSIIANYSDPLATLQDQDISLEGDGEMSIEDYLSETLGELPEIGSRFELGNYEAIAGRVGENPALGIFPAIDIMQNVVIIEKDKE